MIRRPAPCYKRSMSATKADMPTPSPDVLSGFLDPEQASRLSLSVPKDRKRREDAAYDREIRKAVQDEMGIELSVRGKPQTVAQIMVHMAVADYIERPSVFKLNAFQQATGEASVKVELSGAADGLDDLAQ